MGDVVSRAAVLKVIREAYGLSDASDDVNDLPDVGGNLLRAAEDLCNALLSHGFGKTSDHALPAEYDTLRNAIEDFREASK